MAATKDAGRVDIDAIKAKMNILPKFQPMYEILMTRGLKIAKLALYPEKGKPSQIDVGNGTPAQKLAQGVTTLIYLLWTQSNKTFDPRLVVPVTFGLTLETFDLLQTSDGDQYTKPVLGEGVELALSGVMAKFGVQPDQIQQVLQQHAASLKSAGANPADVQSAAPKA